MDEKKYVFYALTCIKTSTRLTLKTKKHLQRIGKMVTKLVTRKNSLKTCEKIMDGYFLKGKDKTLKNNKQTFVKQNGNRCYLRAER